jgi:rhodanese-related sulfurtransferase
MDVYRNYQNQFSSTSKISLNDQTDLEFNERPFLIVDLRDRDEFRKNHIISGNLFS